MGSKAGQEVGEEDVCRLYVNTTPFKRKLSIQVFRYPWGWVGCPGTIPPKITENGF